VRGTTVTRRVMHRVCNMALMDYSLLESDMPGSPFFVQRCPTCGRQAKIDVNYLSLLVVCQHCDNSFIATDSDMNGTISNDPISYWIQIADHVLDEPALGEPAMILRPR
jgi:uncharacterized protein (DUF983 family)